MLIDRSVREACASAAPSTVLLESSLVQVGQFRCPAGHPRFPDSGPTRAHCFVFPRTAVWIQHAGGRPFVADSTIVPLYNPGHPYRRSAISRDGDRTDWFSVAPAVLREMLALRDRRAADARNRLFRVDFARVDARTFLAQRRIFHHVHASEPPDLLYVEEAVIGVLDHVLASMYGPKPETAPAPARHRELAEGLRAQLARTFARHDGLAALANTLGSSVFQLCRVFKRQTGWTIHGYRNQLRLRTSLELLGDLDILSTALALGYSGHSHFTSAFHRTFGVTPSEFRKRTVASPTMPRSPTPSASTHPRRIE